MKRRFLALVFVILLTAVVGMTASAQLNVMLPPGYYSIKAGETVTVSGTLANVGSFPISLVGGGWSYSSPINIDNCDYVPIHSQLVIPAGEEWTGPLFDIVYDADQQDPAIPDSPWIECEGWIDWEWSGEAWPGENVYGRTNYLFEVLLTPEPSGIIALASGLGVLAFRRKRTGK